VKCSGPGRSRSAASCFDKSPEANWLVPWHQDLTIAVRARVDAKGYGPWTVKGGIPHVQPPVPVLERMLTARVAPRRQRRGARPFAGRARVARAGEARGGADPRLARAGPIVDVSRPPRRRAADAPLDPARVVAVRRPGRRRVVHLEYAAGPLPGGVAWFESEAPGR